MKHSSILYQVLHRTCHRLTVCLFSNLYICAGSWQSAKDDDGHMYFWNTSDEVAIWEHPLHSSLKSMANTFRSFLYLYRNNCRQAAAGLLQDDISTFHSEATESLTAWRWTSADGKVRGKEDEAEDDLSCYYWNSETQETTRSHPRATLQHHLDMRQHIFGMLLDNDYITELDKRGGKNRYIESDSPRRRRGSSHSLSEKIKMSETVRRIEEPTNRDSMQQTSSASSLPNRLVFNQSTYRQSSSSLLHFKFYPSRLNSDERQTAKDGVENIVRNRNGISNRSDDDENQLSLTFPRFTAPPPLPRTTNTADHTAVLSAAHTAVETNPRETKRNCHELIYSKRQDNVTDRQDIPGQTNVNSARDNEEIHLCFSDRHSDSGGGSDNSHVERHLTMEIHSPTADRRADEAEIQQTAAEDKEHGGGSHTTGGIKGNAVTVYSRERRALRVYRKRMMTAEESRRELKRRGREYENRTASRPMSADIRGSSHSSSSSSSRTGSAESHRQRMVDRQMKNTIDEENESLSDDQLEYKESLVDHSSNRQHLRGRSKHRRKENGHDIQIGFEGSHRERGCHIESCYDCFETKKKHKSLSIDSSSSDINCISNNIVDKGFLFGLDGIADCDILRILWPVFE
eukprot:GHVQ01025892.1.p1 GENE.GHVQ01025892.1~~GHVQ01025892.1.p1  ORF type:complete len:629 (+),score=111.47 GHVQ01025892.1:476-2362(+)